ncbi:type VII secretion protein EccCa [Rhodococcus sp. X156]|uniref:type VII secretion protein EccCa n=1 Tax=Rhodococcus sp. X156 TaxID=2499145 RepID=UPI000FD80354|nr:type VII secretion protein EccCa [Rhodococcus sp. X156]
MSTIQFRRTARMSAPRTPGGEVHLEPPPEVPRLVPGGLLMKLMPVVMVVAVVGMVALLITSGGGLNPASLLFPMMMLMSMVGMFAGGGGRSGGQRKAEMNEDRKDYLRYLGQMRGRARQAGNDQRAGLEWVHPDPEALSSMVRTRRMWERRTSDADFCHVRVGRGHQRLATQLVPPQTGPVEELEPIATVALRRFVRAHSVVSELPIAISVGGFAAVEVGGDEDAARALTRAMLAQLVTFHSPEDVLVAVVAGRVQRAEWEWVKWLPHAQNPHRTDALGSERMLFSSLAELEESLQEVLADRGRFSRNAAPVPDQPQLVVVVDGGDVTGTEHVLLEEGLAAVTLLDLSACLGTLASRRGLRLVVTAEGVGARSAAGVERFADPDAMSVAQVEALARRLAPYRLGAGGADSGEDPLLSNVGFLDLLGLPDAMTFDVAQAWRPRPLRDRLRVPVGIGEHGEPVELDIKESAQEGMGPHGLCIGATGSGKSEFLRTLVLGMITTHSSAALNLILVDFKGGATFLGLESAPHVAAVITNLADDLTMVDRMKDALAGEMNRRQELLKSAGNFANVKEYERARENGANLDPLPALFIVVDEFSELLSQKPDFADLFVAIGRLGRSLQMHLLLASQRLEEGKLRGLDSHLSYRIGLKTFSASESRTVLGVPDAYELPSIPGSGYLKLDTSTLVRFKAAYVSGPYRAADNGQPAVTAPVTATRRPRWFGPERTEPDAVEPVLAEPALPGAPAPVPESGVEDTLLDVVVRRLEGQGPAAHEVWLPPLEVSPTLDQLLPPLAATPDRGLSPVGFFGNGRLTVPIGIVDKPFEQRRDQLWVDLSGGQGHMAVLGGPQTGKSTALRTFMLALALTHTPAEVQLYCLDFGGGTLGPMAALPHVGSVAGRLDADRVRRTVAELTGLVRRREQRFRDLGIDSMAEFRARRRRGELPETAEDPFGDVFLVIDGWLAFKTEFESLEQSVMTLAAQGLSYGVHLVVASARWAEIRPALKDLLGTRVELRLGDPSESDVDRRVAANVPQGRPGRGLSRDKLQMLVALPRVDSRAQADDLTAGIADAAARLTEAWPGRPAPPVRMLPERYPFEALLAATEQDPRDPMRIPIGIDEDELAPAYLDFAAEPHLLVFADSESGKTALLRSLCTQVMARTTPKQAKFIVADYRRTLLGVVSGDHLAGYAASAAVLTDMINEIVVYLNARMPDSSVTQEQLRDRSWWSGPEIYVVVDDYDLVATGSGNPLSPLVDLLAQAKDVGLHLVVTRRSGGAARALYDPVIARLRDLASPGLVMSGSRDEGALVGTVKPSAQPPGRGVLVSRKLGQRLVQLAWLPPQ